MEVDDGREFVVEVGIRSLLKLGRNVGIVGDDVAIDRCTALLKTGNPNPSTRKSS